MYKFLYLQWRIPPIPTYASKLSCIAKPIQAPGKMDVSIPVTQSQVEVDGTWECLFGVYI